jgi:hypothetical protein
MFKTLVLVLKKTKCISMTETVNADMEIIVVYSKKQRQKKVNCTVYYY